MAEITSVIPDADPNRKQLHLRRIGLKVVSGPDEGKTAEFDHDVIRIGAAEGNHFLLTDATVSRRHAEITRTQDGLVLRDLGSTNGTYLGQVRIKEVYLETDDGEMMGKKAVMGAVTLYLDFVNLFVLLLQLFGGRRE